MRRPAVPARALVHAGTGLFALALGVLPAPWHKVAAGLGVLAGWVVFPLTGIDEKLRRPGESYLGGLRTYPLAVLLLVWFLPRPHAAAAWGILAFGDAAAGWIGRRVPAPRLLPRGKATWTGSGAYVGAGFLAAWGLSAAVVALDRSLGWVHVGAAPGPGWCALAVVAAAATDLVRIPPDDNLPAALAAGLVLAAAA